MDSLASDPLEPPAYSRPLGAPTRRSGTSPRPPNQVKHTYVFTRPSGNTITLEVVSRASNSASTPFFNDEDVIEGTVSLDIPAGRSDQTKSVSIEVRGYKVVSTSKGNTNDLGSTSYQRLFLSLPVKLHPSSSSNSLESGKHTWPFSIRLPSTFVAEARHGVHYKLPPSFSRSGFPEFIHYEIQVTAAKGLLRTDESLVQPFLYLGRTTPASLPSERLQLAYENQLPLPTPANDPEGWEVTETSLKGHVLEWETEVTLKLAAPKPLQYARGSTIPFFISIIINSVTPLATSSYTSTNQVDPSAYAQVFHALLASFDISLQSLYLVGHSAGKGYDPNNSEALPSAEEIVVKAEPMHQLLSTGLFWSMDPMQQRYWTADRDEKDALTLDAGLARGTENWVQGECAVRANAYPDFVYPSLRLTHALSLRFRPNSTFFPLPNPNPPSSGLRRLHAPQSPPVLFHTIEITTTALPGAKNRSYAPAPEYDYRGNNDAIMDGPRGQGFEEWEINNALTY